MYEFIADLDEYFCETYANYDRLCVLPGYKMPKMQDSELCSDGRTRTYTLPANTMRLALQENKREILQTLKQQAGDKTFSFSFYPLGLFARIKNKFSSRAFLKTFKSVLSKNSVNLQDASAALNVSNEVWRNIYKGNFLPTKNLIFSLALTAHLKSDDVRALLTASGYHLDFTQVKDVVVWYLIEQKVFHRGMIEAALLEYHVENLFLKEENQGKNA